MLGSVLVTSSTGRIVFCHRILSQKYHKVLCNSDTGWRASRKATAFLHMQTEPRIPTEAGKSNAGAGGQGGMGWGRRHRMGGLDLGQGKIGDTGTHCILSPFQTLIHPHGSTWISTSNNAGTGPSAAAGAYPRARGQTSLYSEVTSSSWNLLTCSGACTGAAISPRGNLIRIRLPNSSKLRMYKLYLKHWTLH